MHCVTSFTHKFKKKTWLHPTTLQCSLIPAYAAYVAILKSFTSNFKKIHKRYYVEATIYYFDTFLLGFLYIRCRTLY